MKKAVLSKFIAICRSGAYFRGKCRRKKDEKICLYNVGSSACRIDAGQWARSCGIRLWHIFAVDSQGVYRLCDGKQYRSAAESQSVFVRNRGHQAGQGGSFSITVGFHFKCYECVGYDKSAHPVIWRSGGHLSVYGRVIYAVDDACIFRRQPGRLLSLLSGRSQGRLRRLGQWVSDIRRWPLSRLPAGSIEYFS